MSTGSVAAGHARNAPKPHAAVNRHADTSQCEPPLCRTPKPLNGTPTKRLAASLLRHRSTLMSQSGARDPTNDANPAPAANSGDTPTAAHTPNDTHNPIDKWAGVFTRSPVRSHRLGRLAAPAVAAPCFVTLTHDPPVLGGRHHLDELVAATRAGATHRRIGAALLDADNGASHCSPRPTAQHR